MEKNIAPAAFPEGIPLRKFVMVIDLAKCGNARKCVEKCQKAHNLPPNQEFMKVYLMQESEESAPYWMPKPCFHCDEPLCITKCPVEATYKRPDGIVYIDQESCIGCKSCMTGCPYSSRQLNGPDNSRQQVQQTDSSLGFSGEESFVGKCDFCADIIYSGTLPLCVSACPTGTIYFGDEMEDTLSNGNETVSFSGLIASRLGYGYLEELRTTPRVYYLPTVNPQIVFDHHQKKE